MFDWIKSLLVVFVLACISVSAIAEDDVPGSAADARSAPQGLIPIPDYTGDLPNRSRLAGDFNGGRTALANKGIQIDVDWTQYAQSIVTGGRDSDSHYGGHLDYLIQLDLMRMSILPGAF